MKVVLCGMMGSGKTTIGKALAEALSWEWLDTDEYIVSRYGDISGIFEKEGEAYFRGLEKELVQQLVEKDRLVVSTGGGLILDADNGRLLKKDGKSVYLRAKKETLVERLRLTIGRPLLQTGETLGESIERLLGQRKGVYESVADYIIDVDDKEPKEIVEEIFALLR